ncbi:MAG TPA: metallopeptidase family protein, partial [Anaeromyxobacter sp.]|nr:metallopeptidase family protein [Anaeromyxobacter sp.]
ASRASLSLPSATRSAPPADGRVQAKRPACVPQDPRASAGVLAEEAEDALARGEDERALSCSEEAIRISPRLVQALVARASALGGLGKLDEARLAWSRALAVDPSDPNALLGAADLHVRRLGPARDALEIGLEYALRGARAAQARKDRLLSARLELVAGMAENDLGRSHLALPHLERAVQVLPDDADAVYERGVALYELCRFDEAQRVFERALSLAPDDPWVLHQLGLLAERRGDADRAERLLARARKLAPEEFQSEVPLDPDGFRAEVQHAVSTLPDEERRSLVSVPVEIQDLPDAADLVAVDPPLSPSILGLFRGPSENEPCTASDGPRCRAIVFYRKNLLRFARDRRELTHEIQVTLLHELGHLHGENDDDLRARGLE